MTESESTRKRSRSSSSSDHHHTHSVHNASLDILPIIKSPSPSTATTTGTNAIATSINNNHHHTIQQLKLEISNLKTELSTNQNFRHLEKRKHETTEKRLKRYITSLEEEIQSCNTLVDDIKTQSEKAIHEMNQRRKDALEDARDWQEKYNLLMVSSTEEASNFDGGNIDLVMKENELLKKQIKAREGEILALRNQLLSSNTSCNTESTTEVTDEGISSPMRSKISKPNENDNNTLAQSPISPAPTAILSELNRTRVKQAEAERLNRQLTQKVTDLQSKADQYVTYREKVSKAEHEIENLEKELRSHRREREMHKLIEERWTEFRNELIKNQNEILGDISRNSVSGISGDDENMPPEISTVLRQFHVLKAKVQELESMKTSKENLIRNSELRIQSLQKEVKDLQANVANYKEDNQKLSHNLRKIEDELKTVQSQEKIWKRQNESMMSLVESYEKMEENLSKGKTIKREEDPNDEFKSTQKDFKSYDALQLRLKSAMEELDIIQNRCEHMKTENTNLEKEKEAASEELTRVKTKFEKLRDALYQEREKAEKAEKRAFEAESLAGKGSFNLETTRVLHFEKNPTSLAMQEKYLNEIKTLKEELQTYKSDGESSGGKGFSKGKSQVSALDAQKLHKRLKESFRAQIAHFREGVYLLTGYKIDMVSEMDRPKFKVRSMYAENESDVLEFIWPELEEGKSPISLDMLNTKMGEALSRDPCFKYIEKYESLPAFMASVCLSLFEKQTLMS